MLVAIIGDTVGSILFYYFRFGLKLLLVYWGKKLQGMFSNLVIDILQCYLSNSFCQPPSLGADKITPPLNFDII